MKFRTEIQIEPLSPTIAYTNKILVMGSCFSEHIANRLLEHKFNITANPTGIMFNPMSIAKSLYNFYRKKAFQEKDLHNEGEWWFNYEFHSDFSALSREEAYHKMEQAANVGIEAFHRADTIIITWGTAWVYKHDNKVVANCHKQPAKEFSRECLSLEWLLKAYRRLIGTHLKGKRIILTISPVRHLGDSLQENAYSKSLLRVAAGILSREFEQVTYFPSYEILMDDLRDYRFYAEDLVHPSSQAVEYVWEKFAQAAFSSETLNKMAQIAKIQATLHHRPRNPQSQQYKELLQKTFLQMDAIPEIDFREERAKIKHSLEINS